jgi:gluconate 2-dehydrogenase gamma chain
MNVSRRELLAGAAALVVVHPAVAQHVHAAVAAEKTASGAYEPKCFTAQEYKTLTRLADMIIPADEHSPGALDGGAPEFIDLLASQNSELAAIYTGGLAWLDHEMVSRYGGAFADARPADQTAMLDLISSPRPVSAEIEPGSLFFVWVRKMVVDAFFTSKPGIEYLGYQGNGALAKFEVPREALEYALKRSGL